MSQRRMSDDYEVKRTIWDGKVPIEFVLDDSEFRSTQSFFSMLPRVSYFPLCLSKPLEFFMNNVTEIEDSKNVWLESNGTTVKWHYPIGVLYDSYVADQSLPWVVTVKFKNFPDDLVRCGTIESMKHYFLQTVKEADYLKHKGAVMAAMKADEHSQLFNSLYNDKFDDFWNVNKKLMDNSETKLINIPMRFYLKGQPFRQILISADPEPESNEAVLLSSVFKKICPELELSDYTLMSHGISVPSDSPILWLNRNLAYPDNFVHLVVQTRRITAGGDF